MAIHGTASQLKVDGPYVEFQLGVLRALPRDIAPDIAEGWRNNGQALAKALRKALLPLGESEPASVPQPTPLLIPAGTTVIPATMIPFAAKDGFVVNTQRNAPVKIGLISDDFQAWFLAKVEQPFEGSTLKYKELSHASDDDSIIAALGTKEELETTLAEVLALMSAQLNGEPGALLTNGHANIFYVRDAQGELRTVQLYWLRYRKSWEVNASPFSIPCGRRVGARVFSRDSR